MRVTEFRKHKYLPGQWAKELETNGILQLVIKTLQDEHPDNYPIPTDISDDISPTKAGVLLGEARGYNKVLNTIKKLAEPLTVAADPGEPTYADPRVPETQAT